MFEKVQQSVIDAIASQLDIKPAEINGDTTLTEDLKIDSLDFVEICMALEEEYGVDLDNDDFAKSITTTSTINDVVEYIVSLGITD